MEVIKVQTLVGNTNQMVKTLIPIVNIKCIYSKDSDIFNNLGIGDVSLLCNSAILLFDKTVIPVRESIDVIEKIMNYE